MKSVSIAPQPSQNPYGRADIANGLFDKMAEAGAKAGIYNPLSAEERRRSLEEFLALRPNHHQGPIWVFGYASLIWNPAFHFRRRCLARIYGHHRSLCLKSPLGRGSPDCPGLLFGLDVGGSCQGVVYELEPDYQAQELEILWSREMMGGSYRPVWLAAHCQNHCDHPASAIGFVIRHDTNRFMAKVNQETMVAMIAKAKGELGTCREYFDKTRESLLQENIHDRLVETIYQELLSWDEANQ